jgi:hypothetical protein
VAAKTDASSNTIFFLRSDTTLIANYIQQIAKSLNNAFTDTTIHSIVNIVLKASCRITVERKKLVLKSGETRDFV